MTENPLLALLPPESARPAQVLWRRASTSLTYRALGAEFGVSERRAQQLTRQALHRLRVWYAGNPRLRAAREPHLRALCRPYPDLYRAVFGEAP